MLSRYIKLTERAAILNHLIASLQPYLPTDAVPEAAKKMIHRASNITITIQPESFDEVLLEIRQMLEKTEQEIEEISGYGQNEKDGSTEIETED